MAKESMKAREVKREKIVAKYAAKRKALKKAGDYITKEILDTPVIIIRDKSKKIRVFANVCRHWF